MRTCIGCRSNDVLLYILSLSTIRPSVRPFVPASLRQYQQQEPHSYSRDDSSPPCAIYTHTHVYEVVSPISPKAQTDRVRQKSIFTHFREFQSTSRVLNNVSLLQTQNVVYFSEQCARQPSVYSNNCQKELAVFPQSQNRSDFVAKTGPENISLSLPSSVNVHHCPPPREEEEEEEKKVGVISPDFFLPPSLVCSRTHTHTSWHVRFVVCV